MPRQARLLASVLMAAALATACGGGGETYRAPQIDSFEAFPLEKFEGEYRLLSWETQFADRVALYERVGSEGAYDYVLVFESENVLSGVMEYRVHGTRTIELRAYSTRSHHDPATATLDVTPTVETPRYIRSFYPDESWLDWGENAVLNYAIENPGPGMTLHLGLAIHDWDGTEIVRDIPETSGLVEGQFTVDDCATPTNCLLRITHHTGFYAELLDAAGETADYMETYVGMFEIGLPEILEYYPDDDTIVVGDSTNLNWEVHQAEEIEIVGFGSQFCDAWLECRGTQEVTPDLTRDYEIKATGPGGVMMARVTITVLSTPTPPTVNSFTASPTTIHPHAPTTLTWDTTLADSVDITAAPADPTLPTTFTTDGSAVVSPAVTTIYTIVATNTTGTDSDTATVTVTPLAAGDLVISEIMTNPATVLDTDGEWFEIYNHSTMQANLNGLTITDGTTSDTVDVDVLVAAGGYALLALSSDTSLNDNLPTPDFVYSGLSLDETATGSLAVRSGTTTLDTVAWDGSSWTATEGRSWSLDPDMLTHTDNDSFTNWCNGASMWTGAAHNYGSPGAANPDC